MEFIPVTMVDFGETGEGFPEISLLKPLAKTLGTTVDDLLSDEEEEKTEKPKHNFLDLHTS